MPKKRSQKKSDDERKRKKRQGNAIKYQPRILPARQEGCEDCPHQEVPLEDGVTQMIRMRRWMEQESHRRRAILHELERDAIQRQERTHRNEATGRSATEEKTLGESGNVSPTNRQTLEAP